MYKEHKIVDTVALIVCLAVFASSNCNPGSDGRGNFVEQDNGGSSVLDTMALMGSPSSTRPLPASGPACYSARIAVLADQTESTVRTRAPQLAPEQFEPLLETIRNCGGELRVGPIRDFRPGTLTALAIATPTTSPVAAGSGEILSDPFEEIARQHELQVLEDQVERETSARHLRADSLVAVFRRELAAVLVSVSLATSTEILQAVARADVYLAEPTLTQGRDFLVVVSDGEHNASNMKTPTLRSRATVVVVNGTGQVGILDAFQPMIFENFDAALRWIVEEVYYDAH